MNIVLLYYSGAGNTKYIALNILKRLNERGHHVDISRITNVPLEIPNKEIDLFIVGFPVMNMEAPRLVEKTINHLNTKDKPIAYFCTKAIFSSEAIHHLSEMSTQRELRTVAKLDLYMPATDALAFIAKKGSKTEKVLRSFHSRNIGKKLNQFIKKAERGKRITISRKWYTYLSFLIPKKSKKSINNQFTKYIPDFYVQNESCVQCMLCVHNCPEKNITFEDMIQFGTNCDMCLRCLHHCPTDAIQIGQMTIGKARYNEVKVPICD